MRQDVTFPSEGLKCAGWLYVPDDLKSGERRPAIVMAQRSLPRVDGEVPGVQSSGQYPPDLPYPLITGGRGPRYPHTDRPGCRRL